MSTTNYFNTFIEVAEDCLVDDAEAPPERSRKTKVRMQYEMILDHPYEYTSDDVIFNGFAEKHSIPEEKRAGEREKFSARDERVCGHHRMASATAWGIHSDADGKVAIYAVESDEYRKLASDQIWIMSKPCAPGEDKFQLIILCATLCRLCGSL